MTTGQPSLAFLNAFLNHLPDQVLRVIDTQARASDVDTAWPLLEHLDLQMQDRISARLTRQNLRDWCAVWWGLQTRDDQVQRWCTFPLNDAFCSARRETRSITWFWDHRPTITGSFAAWDAWWSLGDDTTAIQTLNQRHIRYADRANDWNNDSEWNNGVSWMASPMEIATLFGDRAMMQHLHDHGVPLYTPQRSPDDASPMVLAIWRAQTVGDEQPLHWLLDHGARWDLGWKSTGKLPLGLVPRWTDAAWAHPATRERARIQGTPWDLAMRTPGPVRDLAQQAFLEMSPSARRKCAEACVYAPSDPMWPTVEGIQLRASMGKARPSPPRSRSRL